ncbi:Hydrolase, haloacid delahogenase-like family [Roseibacterium elongatum DSM 19469]|uniref:Hydrolase, haloacid delahogenase-like family n=1 Tax=Roseicyclus elongatus DSM 19469 TaxID=1294273 RepID=W8SKP8_9RHOB|nr:Hydrolase, haloacid delahogenase-like family [Roseibacterium elongatum DSM 19469]
MIAEILSAGQEMLSHPIDLLPHAEEAVRALAQSHRIVMITKGDLLDQERKLAQSGLGEMFDAVEIVSDKRAPTYSTIFDRHGDGAERAMMIGNSMKSDVLPALEVGAWGVFVPHGLTWELEHASAPEGHPRYAERPDLGAVVELVHEIETQG